MDPLAEVKVRLKFILAFPGRVLVYNWFTPGFNPDINPGFNCTLEHV